MTSEPVVRSHDHLCDECAVQSSFCPLVNGVREPFEQLKTSVRFRTAEIAFREADPCRTVFVVCAGRLKLVTSSKEGRLLLLRFAEPGEILGLAEAMLGGSPYECSAIAVEPSVLALVPRDTFLRFVASYPQVACRITFALSQQYYIAQQEEKFLGRGDSSAIRLAHLLLQWSQHRGRAAEDGLHIALRVTHNDLAQAIGSTRETVTRILSDLSQRGIVARTAKEIVIRSPAELTRLAS